MMRSLLSLGFVFFLVFLTSCEKDSKNGNTESRDFIVAFEEQSIGYSEIKDEQYLKILFSEVALGDGSIKMRISQVNAQYNVDYNTLPEVVDSTLEVPFYKGDVEVSFLFKNLIYPFDRSDKTVQFEIVDVNYSVKTPKIRGFSVMAVSFDTALGGVLSPKVGGANQAHQVYVDLGGKAMYSVQRDSWDLAFYAGGDSRVKLNGSIYMASSSLMVNDIDLVTETSLGDLKNKVQIGTFDPANVAFIDNPSGELEFTAIKEISDDDSDNRVYLLNLGFKPGEGSVPLGSVNVAGDVRGWKKIRILKRGSGYLLQYANLNESSHKEVFIDRKQGYNFTFFSFDAESVVDVEPSLMKWDLNFTVFTNVVDQDGDPKGSYGYSDFIITNRYAGVLAYRVVMTTKESYKEFNIESVQDTLFEEDIRVIGGSWRDVTSDKVLYRDVFYVIKDSKGNLYKMRMLGFVNEKGERGYPKFEYSLLR